MPRRTALHNRRPSWLWRWHHLLSVFVVFFGIGMIVAALHVSDERRNVVQASVGGNIAGWIWADSAGWISTSSSQPGACPGPGSCGSYGLNIDPISREINGYAWSDSAGWICFGTSCSSSGGACGSVPPTAVSGPGGTIMEAWIDTIPTPAPSYVKAHGWANICNLGDDGWISLNCEEAPGSGGVGCPSLTYKYGVVYMSGATDHGYFGTLAGSSPDSFGWNGNTAGTGYGYFDFHKMYFLGTTENTVGLCSDGKDNDLNGAIDCSDPSCAILPMCLPEASCGAGAVACCTDLTDNNANGLTDCADPSCAAQPICLSSPENPSHNNPTHPFVNVCGDGVDNDSNGLTDCADPVCSTYAGCSGISQGTGIQYILTVSSTVSAGGNPATTVPITVPSCLDGIKNSGSPAADCLDPACAADPVCLGPTPVGDVATLNPATDQALIDYLCSDGLANGKPHALFDCQDPTCQAKSTICGSFIQAKFGNIYAQQGITGSQATPSRGSYCLGTTGSITNFSSDAGCTDTGSGALSLPSSGSSYKGTLGSLDIAGILAGRYGTVIPIISDAGLPAVLGGKVYYSSTDLVLNAKTFSNGGAQRGNPVTERGNGLLIVSGDLYINGNIGYQTENIPQSVRNLSSFGVIVQKRADGTGGNIYIAPSVTSVSGAYFAEVGIYTGTSSPAPDTPLAILGLMATKQFHLQRVYPSSTVAAETFTQDGRAVANPPPGMQDLGKSLPVQKDAF